MLKEIHLAGSVRTPFGSFCGAFADVSAIELGKAAVERSTVKPEDVKELLVGNILSDNMNKGSDQASGFRWLWTNTLRDNSRRVAHRR